ncbi:hypothetical protein Ntsu_78590 [Nocardia sp. IFM 10818]
MWSLDNFRTLCPPAGPEGNNHYMTVCPAHADGTASLHVTWVPDPDCGGRLLLFCHGCRKPADEIVAGIDPSLTTAILYDEPLKPRERTTPRVGRTQQARRAGKRRTHGRLPAALVKLTKPRLTHAYQEVCRYDYTDPDTGALVEQVIRQKCETCTDADGVEIHKPHKTFKQEYVLANGRRVSKKPPSFRPVLYRHRELREAVAAGQVVWLLEGEKDCDTALAHGQVATTNAQGAGNFPTERAGEFRGATVHVVLDRDPGGYARGLQLAKLFADVGDVTVRLLLPAVDQPKADYTDHVEGPGLDLADPLHGFLPVTVAELAAHHATAELREKIHGEMVSSVAYARFEAGARAALAADADADAGDDAPLREQELKRAQAWAMETERRYEAVADLLAQTRAHARRACTPFAQNAVDAAEQAWDEAKRYARAAYEDAELPVPEPLLDADEIALARAQETRAEPSPAGASGRAGTGPRPDAAAGDLPDEGEFGSVVAAPTYRILGGRLVELVTRDGRQQLRQILSLDARVVAMEYLENDSDDDDVTRPTLYGREHLDQDSAAMNPPEPETLATVVIAYTDPATGELTQRRISADSWRERDCRWLDSLPGPPQYDSRSNSLAKLRDALKVAGGDNIRRVVRHRATGWRRDEASNTWYFVHASGAIDADGYRVAPVSFDGPMSRYNLPAPATVARLREAFLDDCGALLTELPNRVAAPLLGHVFRAALGPNPWVLLLVGSPGSYKTGVATLGMHCWGELWDRRHPGTSLSGNGDTLNAVRIKLHQAKDCLYWFDDVAPTKDWTAAQKLLEEIARLVHNAEERSRSTRDGLSVLSGTAPRASAMVTSEVAPRPGSSGGQRTFPVPMIASEISVETLKKFDHEKSRYGRALVMSGFLQWLAGNLDKARALAQERSDKFAELLMSQGRAVRTAQAAGDIWSGWPVLLRFLVEVGALDEAEATTVETVAEIGMVAALEASVDPDLPSTTGARIRELLAHALRTGIGYVDDVRTGKCPDGPLATRLGWKRTPLGAGFGGAGEDMSGRYRDESRGIRMGYVLTDPTVRDGGEPQLLLWKPAIEQVLKETCSRMTDAPQVDVQTALRALADDGLLITEKRGTGVRHTVWRTLHAENRRQRMVVVKLWPLLGGEDDPGDDVWDDGDGPDPDPDATLTMPLRELLGSECRGSDVASAATDPGPTDTPAADPDPTSADQDLTIPDDDIPQESDMGVSRAPCDGQYELTLDADVGAPVSLPPEPAPATEQPARDEEIEQPSVATDSASGPTAAAEPATAVGRPPLRLARPDDEFTAPVVVADVDGVWLPDGTSRPLPDPLTHVGHLADLVTTLNLGCRVTEKWTEVGQVWVTPALLARLGVAVPEPNPSTRQARTNIEEATTGLPLVTDARAAGWGIGGAGDRLGPWTRMWGDDRRAWIVLIAGLPKESAERDPLFGDDPSPATVARRLTLFSDALRWPYRVTSQITGFDLLFSTRRDRDVVFKATDLIAPERISALEDDLQWNRQPTAEELRMRFAHAFDRSGSHVGGMASLSVGVGHSIHFPDGRPFDAKLPGYWRAEVGEAADWRFPHPLLPGGATKPGPLWVTTPTMQLARELGYEPEVLEAYVWPEHARVFDGFYERVRDARAALDLDDPDAQAARDLLKTVYTRTIGQMGSELTMQRKALDPETGKQITQWKDGFAQHRRHHIIAKARSNILRFVHKTGTATGRWPVAIDNDTLIYLSDDPNPESAFPGARGGQGARDTWGRAIGQYKWEGSALLTDQLPFLDGRLYQNKAGFSGKTALTKDGWDIEQMRKVSAP